MPAVPEPLHDVLHRVVAVELPNPGTAEHLARELSVLFPASRIKQESSLHVVVDAVGAENRLMVEVLGAIQLWLNKDGIGPLLVQIGDKTYLLEADVMMETLGATPNRP
jgi:hypothetical protein